MLFRSQVPTKKLPLEALHATEQNPIPAKQLAINYLCQKNAEVETLCEREKTDSVAMVLPITTHLYIESLVVDTPHRKLGVATAMLDFLISMAAPETVSMFAGHEQAEVMAMLKKLKFIEAPIVATDVPWKKKNFFYKRLKRLTR